MLSRQISVAGDRRGRFCPSRTFIFDEKCLTRKTGRHSLTGSSIDIKPLWPMKTWYFLPFRQIHAFESQDVERGTAVFNRSIDTSERHANTGTEVGITGRYFTEDNDSTAVSVDLTAATPRDRPSYIACHISVLMLLAWLTPKEKENERPEYSFNALPLGTPEARRLSTG